MKQNICYYTALPKMETPYLRTIKISRIYRKILRISRILRVLLCNCLEYTCMARVDEYTEKIFGNFSDRQNGIQHRGTNKKVPRMDVYIYTHTRTRKSGIARLGTYRAGDLMNYRRSREFGSLVISFFVADRRPVTTLYLLYTHTYNIMHANTSTIYFRIFVVSRCFFFTADIVLP